MYQLAPNLDILFTEAGEAPADRVRAAAAAGFDAAEIWTTLDKDIDALAGALEETGVTLTSIIAEPRTNFSWPGTDLAPYWDGLERGVANAKRLGCSRLVLGSGLGFPGLRRAQNVEKLMEVFRRSIDLVAGTGVRLLLEPVNTRVDHPGALTDRTAEALMVARELDSPGFGILYDLYHSIVEGEDPEAELRGAADLIGYVHIADAPGRGQPGSGEIDWPLQLSRLRSAGYNGPLGLEYFPTVPTIESFEYIRSVAAAV
jgi:hydroxypyruvate isomerase